MAFEGYCGNCEDFKDKDNDNLYFNQQYARYEKGHCVRYGCYYWADDTCSKQKDKNQYSGCYITTIVCNILGCQDNSGVLCSLRSLRDDIMQKDKKYKELLYEYDSIGPKIASKLLEDNDVELATALYNFYILPSASLINKRKYEEAIIRYQEMTNGLKETFGIENTNKIPENYDYEKGGHGKLFIKII